MENTPFQRVRDKNKMPQSTMVAMSDLSALNLEEGSLVGGYTLIARLGSGAMGSVWRVRDDGGHQYAMKILRDSLTEDGTSAEASRDQMTARERLRREAMSLQKVRHPGVCGIVDMELDDALAFIVTELIEGKNLREDVRINGRYVGDDLERLSRKLIAAVKAVHAAGIVHRDIKPTNVMVSTTGPVLVDFGIAMGEGESHVTRTGLVMGTPGFIAPEIIDGTESDEMTDWWSVASVLAFAATGEPVFGTKPMMAVLERAAAGNANLSGLPAGTMAALRSALDPDRSKRCTPDALLQAIALDALNPLVWQQAQQSAQTPPAGDATEMMPPFDESAQGNVSNPRALWYLQDDVGGEDAIGTQTMPRIGEATRVIAADTDAPTRTLGTMDADTDVIPTQGDTRPLPRTLRGEQTQTMPTMPMQDAWNPQIAPTQVDPTIKPALQRVVNQSTAQAAPQPLPPSVIPHADIAQSQQLPMQQPSQPYVVAGQPSQFASAIPQNAIDPNAPQPPNPADVKRGEYLSRGVLPCALLSIPVAICALLSPWMALGVALALSWVLFTIGCNVESQLEREGRRGGERRKSDWAIRVASLPWHMLKGFGYACARMLIMVIIMALGLAISTLALHLPYALLDVDLFGLTVPLPTFTEGPLSQSGLVQAGFGVIGWLVAAIAPGAMVMRLGAGSLRGAR